MWKELLKQKTTWAGLGIIVTGIGMCLGDLIPPAIIRGLLTVLSGASVVFLRQAVSKVPSANMGLVTAAVQHIMGKKDKPE